MVSTRSSIARASAPVASDSSSPSTVSPRASQYDLIPIEARQLLEQYSNIPTADIQSHILALRNRAFRLIPFDKLSQLDFFAFSLPRNPFFSPLLARLHAGASFIHAGCSTGQDLRFLAHHHAIPIAQLHGFDADERLLELGFRCFNDSHRLANRILCSDILPSPRDPTLTRFDGQIDVVYASALLYSCKRERQLHAAVRLAAMLSPKPAASGSPAIIVGRQLGSRKPRAIACAASPNGFAFRHSETSLKRMWTEVGRLTGLCFSVETVLEIDEAGDDDAGGDGEVWISYCAALV